MPPIAHRTHAIQHRTRFHIPARRHDTAYFAELEKTFAACEGVLSVETNPLTASILLHHQNDSADLARYAHQHDLFIWQPPTVEANLPIARVVSWLEGLDQAVQRLTQGAFDLNGVVFVSLIGASLYQAWRGRGLGSGTSLLSSALAIMALQRTKPVAK